MATELPRKVLPLRSLNLSLADVGRIFDRLSRQVEEQAEGDIQKLHKTEDQDEDAFTANINNIKENEFRISITITGQDWSSLFGYSSDLFRSPSLPDRVVSIYMSNMAAYHAFAGHDPQNRFQLNLDFSKPPLIDTINPVSAPTPNVSSLSIEGDRDAWLAVIQEAVVGVIENRRNRRTWLHRALIYDYGLFFLGAPAALYACWRVSGPIERFLV